MIKMFENGDVLMSGNEYKELMATSGGSLVNWQLACRYRKLMDFYYDLKKKQYDYTNIAAIDITSSKIAIEYKNYYRITEGDFKLFQEKVTSNNNRLIFLRNSGCFKSLKNNGADSQHQSLF